MSLLLLAADPALGSAGTLRAYAGRLGDSTCVVVATREPVSVDVGRLVATHRANGALLTIAVRRLDSDEDRADVLIAGDDDRVMAVQPAPHPDEALSDLADVGVYAVAAEALDHVREGQSELAGEVLGVLLAWDAPVYVHRLDD